MFVWTWLWRKKSSILRGIDIILNPKPARKKQLFDPGTINLVPSFITTRPHNPQRLHQELVTPFGSTATQTWQGFKKAPGRKNYSKIHSKNLHNRHCTKAKPAMARHNAHRIKPQQHQFGRKTGISPSSLSKVRPYTPVTEQPDKQHHWIDILNSIWQLCALQMTDRHK